MAQYLSYRNGSTNLTDRITNALAHFQRSIGASPAALVVNPANLAKASEILQALGLATLDVIGSGGVALSEVWLQQPKPEPKKE